MGICEQMSTACESLNELRRGGPVVLVYLAPLMAAKSPLQTTISDWTYDLQFL